MQYDIRSALRLDRILHRVFGSSFAAPVNGFRVLFVREAENLHFLAHHKCGIETETEMTDDCFGFVFVLVQKLLRAAERNLVDELVHLFGCHSDSVVGDSKRLLILIYTHAHTRVAQIAFHFTYGR